MCLCNCGIWQVDKNQLFSGFLGCLFFGLETLKMKDWFYSSTVVVYITRHCHNLKPFITAGVKRKSSRTALQITFDQCPKKTTNKNTMNL